MADGIGLTDKIVPKHAAFTGLVQASQVLGGGDDGTLPVECVADETVTYAKMQHVSGTNKLLGRASAGAGDVEEITCTAAGRAMLDDADAEAQRATLGLASMALELATAFLRLAGVSGGQTAYGGTDASDGLKLKSTSHATKGIVEIGDEGDIILGADGQSTPTEMKPSVDEMIDLGTISLRFRDLYASRPHVPVSDDDVSDPPTDGELDTAFGTPATVGEGFVGLVDDDDANTKAWIVFSLGGSWWHKELTKAV